MTMTEHSSSSPADDAVPGPGRVTGRQLRELLADDMWLDELIDRAEQGGVRLTGDGGFLPEMIKAVLERGLGVGEQRNEESRRQQSAPGHAWALSTVCSRAGGVPQ